MLPPPAKRQAAAAEIPARGWAARRSPRSVLRRLRGRRDVPWRSLGDRPRLATEWLHDVFVPPGQGCCGASICTNHETSTAHAAWPTRISTPSNLDRYDAIRRQSRRLRRAAQGIWLPLARRLAAALALHFAEKVKDVHGEFLDSLGRSSVERSGIETVASYHDLPAT